MARVSPQTRTEIQPGSQDGLVAVAAREAPSRRHVSASPTPAILRLTAGDTSRPVASIGWFMLCLALLVLAGQALLGVDPQDEGQFLTYPWLIAHGHMPYRDIWMSYPPATYLLMAGLFKAGIPGLFAERAFGFLARVAYVLIVNRSVTRSWTRFSWLGVPVTFGLLFMSSDIKAYPWIVALPLLFLGLWTMQERLWLSSAMFFLAGTVRFELGLAGCVALLTMAGLQAFWGRPCRAALVTGAGLAAGLLGFYLALDAVTAGTAIRQIFYDQIVLAEPARRIPLFPLAFGPLGIPFLPVTLLGPVLLAVAGLKHRQAHLVGTNLGVITLLPHFFQRTDASHLFSTAVITVPWTIVGLLQWAEGSRAVMPGLRSGHHCARAAATALTFVGCTVGVWCSLIVVAYAVYMSPLSPLSADNVAHLPSGLVKEGSNLTISSSAAQARDDRQVISYLMHHGRPNQGVFITPLAIDSSYTRTDLYYALGFRPCTTYMEVQGGVQTRPDFQRRILRQLAHCRWVIVVQGGMWYRGSSAAHIPASDLIAPFLRHHYRPVLRNQTYQVLEQLASGPLSVAGR